MLVGLFFGALGLASIVATCFFASAAGKASQTRPRRIMLLLVVVCLAATALVWQSTHHWPGFTVEFATNELIIFVAAATIFFASRLLAMRSVATTQ